MATFAPKCTAFFALVCFLLVYPGAGTSAAGANEVKSCPPRRSMPLRQDRVQYYSQIEQDKVVLALFGNQSGGYFIDLAANDPMHFSNSYSLEQWFGWRGVCIEASPMHAANLRRLRSCHVAQSVVDSEVHEVQFTFSHSTLAAIVANDTDFEEYKRFHIYQEKKVSPFSFALTLSAPSPPQPWPPFWTRSAPPPTSSTSAWMWRARSTAC